MKLIDLLVKELPKLGGWPDGVDAVEQDCEGQLFEMESDYCSDFKLEKCDDWIADVVTKQQYESALAASEGWIDWQGGECPVDSDAIVEVRYWNQNQNQCRYNNDRAGDFEWSHTGSYGDIIAYRLHDQGINARANDDQLEQDLNECIGQDVVTEWDGEGFPPAGCKCEVMESNPRSAFDKWTPCTVIHFNLREGRETQACIIDNNGDFAILYGNDGVKFRPLRTEHEKEREAAETAMRTCLAGTGAGITPMAAKGIYDAIAAGKIPGVKLEDK